MSETFPTVKWSRSKFRSKNKKTEQRKLYSLCNQLFPRYTLYEDYDHKLINFQSSGYMLEFDIFIAELNIGIEYQGQQHFDDISSGFSPIEYYLGRDFEKVNLCKQFSVLLITIPYWWTPSFDSLSLSIFRSLSKSLT